MMPENGAREDVEGGVFKNQHQGASLSKRSQFTFLTLDADIELCFLIYVAILLNITLIQKERQNINAAL